MKIFPFRLACENSQHFTMPPKVSPGNDVWEMSTEISYWWCITTQIWVVLLIGWSKFYQQYDQSEALPRSWLRRVISMELLHSFLRRNSVGGKRGGGGVWGLISENPESRPGASYGKSLLQGWYGYFLEPHSTMICSCSVVSVNVLYGGC